MILREPGQEIKEKTTRSAGANGPRRRSPAAFFAGGIDN
jgi:hypothetical protein